MEAFNMTFEQLTEKGFNPEVFCGHYYPKLWIKKDGTDELYVEAIDLLPCPFTYTVTDKEIEEYISEPENIPIEFNNKIKE